MSQSIECPKSAYERLMKGGLVGKVLRKKQEISELMLYGYDFHSASQSYLLFEKAKGELFKTNTRLSEKSEVWKNILFLYEKIDKNEDFKTDSEMFEESTIEYPSLFSCMILGEELFDYEKYGFPTRKSLEESIASFCIGERWNYFGLSGRGDYTWRTEDGNFKNSLSNEFHGDCWIHQIDVSGKYKKEQTLFGEIESFDTIKDIYGTEDRKGINAHYNYWENLLMIILKYAKSLGKEKIPEIINWRETLEKAGGGVGTMTTEAMFGGGGRSDINLELLFEDPIINADRKEKLETWPLYIRGDSEVNYLPYVFKRNLHFIKSCKDEEGSLDLSFAAPRFKEGKYKMHISYYESDLPHLLTGIYKLFARDRSLLPKIMNKFIEEAK